MQSMFECIQNPNTCTAVVTSVETAELKKKAFSQVDKGERKVTSYCLTARRAVQLTITN